MPFYRHGKTVFILDIFRGKKHKKIHDEKRNPEEKKYLGYQTHTIILRSSKIKLFKKKTQEYY